MQVVDYAIGRYVASLKEIERLKQSEFPYSHSQDALLEVEKALQKQLDALRQLVPPITPLVAKNACCQSLYKLFVYTPFLGLILRSTNVRNAFEVYYPVLRLARLLLGNSAKLLLSSEWDYSPFTYLPDDELKDFVLIGHPAQESSNALLIPLAGHELGHNVWQSAKLHLRYHVKVRRTVIALIESQFWKDFSSVFPQVSKGTLNTTLYAYETWLPAQTWAMQQLEEVFCDCLGIRLFAEAYLHAFAYLLSPNLPGERAVHYPNMKHRVEYLIAASRSLAVTVPDKFTDLFDVEEEPKEPGRKVLVEVADAACKQHFTEMLTDARAHATSCSAPVRSKEEVQKVVDQFRLVIPTKGLVNICDIINAGWISHHDQELWRDVPQITEADRGRILNDLVLKSLEVTEFHERTDPP